MVKLKETTHHREDGSIMVDAWLVNLANKRNSEDLQLIQHACLISQLAIHSSAQDTTVPPIFSAVRQKQAVSTHGNAIQVVEANKESTNVTPIIPSVESQKNSTVHSQLQLGLAMADILLELNMDAETIAAAIVYNSMNYVKLSLDEIKKQLNNQVAKLVIGVKQMATINTFAHQNHNQVQVDNLRKMLLAIVDDVRVVFIKLAERTCILRIARRADEVLRKQLATEVKEIYAPLANRLGIGQLKWELEDLSFHFLEPKVYKNIAKLVDERRIDRDHYVQTIIHLLNKELATAELEKYEVMGRAKHIFSIYKKMFRKNLEFNQIYDTTAVRVLVNTIEDCYKALSTVHAAWPHIPQEFDDYIANPKPNGYRSIHTAIVGPDKKNVEVQIRTFDMHNESELGVAAHWKYKEGLQHKSSYENKIALLRQVLDWQEELTGVCKPLEDIHAAIFKDRVYVFTPTGDIIDLPQGSTPLDFAYYVHTEIGHRCKGAKINGHIVPLTYSLHTGEQVEILTHKYPSPSRDWLNPQLGYLLSSRARSKVNHWFKLQDFDRYLAEGHTLLDKELRRLNLSFMATINILANKFKFQHSNDLLVAVGRGELKINSIIQSLQVETEKIFSPLTKSFLPSRLPSGINIEGIDNLLTQIAKCCKPLPGDVIAGHITTGHGITIHRQDCPNLINLLHTAPKRVMAVDWGQEVEHCYSVDIIIHAEDRANLLRDITLLFSHEKIQFTAIRASVRKKTNNVVVHVTIAINNLQNLQKSLERLRQINGVQDVKRHDPGRNLSTPFSS